MNVYDIISITSISWKVDFGRYPLNELVGFQIG